MLYSRTPCYNLNMQLPQEVEEILEKLKSAGHEAYVVGGCVRDVLQGREPQDWDVTTSATVETIQKLFPENVYENNFGTVSVETCSETPSLKFIEITPFRSDGEYADHRHPLDVTFVSSLLEDLARRDFTINAMAHDGTVLTDPFGGEKDLQKRIISCVGNPNERFNEDALRMLRAIRFASQSGFAIEARTLKSINENSKLIEGMSYERIRDEFTKIILSPFPEKGINTMLETEILQFVAPELLEGVGIEQNKHHVYTVFEHCVKSLQAAQDMDFSFNVRLASLLHDIGKPRTRKLINGEWTFYGHEVVGARMTENLLKRLHYPTETVSKITHLVRYHMFYYDIDKVTEAGARRLLRRVGADSWQELIELRMSERIGSGVPKAEPYRLRHLQYLVEKASQVPLSTSQLAIDGHDLMKELDVQPGPILGGILNALLAEVLDDPSKNTKEYLLKRATELKTEDPKKLRLIGEKAKEDREREEEEKIRQHFRV